jgi:hypothetical protein
MAIPQNRKHRRRTTRHAHNRIRRLQTIQPNRRQGKTRNPHSRKLSTSRPPSSKNQTRHQSELTREILNAYTSGKVAKEKALSIYEILNKENLVAWEDEFSEYIDEYRRTQNIDEMLTSLEQLFQKYRIDIREKRKPKTIQPQDLEVVAYMFLSREDFKELTLEA